MGKATTLIVIIQTIKTVPLTTYSYIMKLLVNSTKKPLMRIENTRHSKRFLESNIYLLDTKIGMEVNMMYKCYGKLEKSLLNPLISLQKIFLLNLHSMKLRTVSWRKKKGWKRFKRYKQQINKLSVLSVKPSSNPIASAPNTSMVSKSCIITNTQWNLTNKMATPSGPMQMYLNMKSYASMMFSLIKDNITFLKYRKDIEKSASISYLRWSIMNVIALKL